MLSNPFNVRVYVTRAGYVSLHAYESNLTRVHELVALGFNWRSHGPNVYDCYVTSKFQMQRTIPKLLRSGWVLDGCIARLQIALEYANATSGDARDNAAIRLRVAKL